jgi:hypothetical protein
MPLATPRCTVVFKTYAWDGFVERQGLRLAGAAGALDFYVSVDDQWLSRPDTLRACDPFHLRRP